MTIKEGPLTPRQTRIIQQVTAGRRHKEVAKDLNLHLGVVRQEVLNVTRKFKADTSAEAFWLYGRAESYLAAAALLEEDAAGRPELHVDVVLNAIAKILRERAAALLPK